MTDRHATHRVQDVPVTHVIALAGLLAFVVVTLAQHALVPELEPARHTISEYVNADAGALMVGGLLAWAASLCATAALVWRADGGARREPATTVLAGLLAVAAVGIVLTASFATQTSAGVLPPGTRRSSAGHVHDLASLVAMLALIGALIASVFARGRDARFRVLAARLLAGAVVAGGVLLAIGDPVDGIRQRVLVATGCTWQAALLLSVRRERPPADLSGT